MSFGTNLQDTVSRLLARYGKDGTLAQSRAESYSPTTGAVTATETTIPIRLFVQTHKVLVDGTMVLTGDKEIYLSAKDIANSVEASDIIYDSVSYYTVIEVDVVSVENLEVLYIVRARVV